MPVLFVWSAFFINGIGKYRDGVDKGDEVSILNHGDYHKHIDDHVEVGHTSENQAFDELPDEGVKLVSLLDSKVQFLFVECLAFWELFLHQILVFIVFQ